MSTSVPPPGYEPPSRSYGAAPAAEPAPVADQPLTETAAPVLARRRRQLRTPIRVAAAAVSLVVAVGVAFLVLGSTSSPVADPIAQAATLSSTSPGYRMNMSMRMTVPGVSTPVFASGSAIVDLRDQAASMTFAIDLSGVPQVQQELGGSTMRMAMVMQGSAIYMQFPQALSAAIPSLGGRTWVKMDLGKLSHLPGLGSLGNSPGMSDPSRMLQYLRAGSNGVSNEGEQMVDGVLTTHYSAMLSLDQLAANVPAAEQPVVQRTLAQLEQTSGMHSFPVNVWIDAHHLVRRTTMSMSMHVAGGAPMQEDMTADFTDYGPQPRPTPPPADQVADLGSLVNVSG